MKKILRIELSREGQVLAWLYGGGKEIKQWIAGDIKSLASSIDKFLRGKWQSIGGVYIFRGPGGFSRLRSIHAFALGLGLGSGIPIAGYSRWQHSYQNSFPKQEDISLIYQK